MIEYMLFGLRLVLLFCTFAGYAFWIKEKLKINTALIFSTVISIITIIVYLGGILGFLRWTTIITAFTGLILFVIYIAKVANKNYNLGFLFDTSVVFFIFMSIYLVILLKGVSYLHYDNFSHWGTIVKEMFYFNSLPNSKTIISAFRNYPPGTAVFIYYACKVIGYNESHALMAQGIFIASFLATLFINAKLKNTVSCICLTLTAVISLCILSYDDTTLNIYNLLVDGVLGFIVSAIIICSYYYKDDIQKLFFTTVPMLSVLVLTKDSGNVFFFMIIVYILFTQYKNLKSKKFFYILGIILFPILITATWKIYVKNSYVINSVDEKFNVSASNLSNTIDSINNINHNFIESLPFKLINEMFKINSINTQLFILVNLLSIITIIFLYIKKKDIKLILNCFILTNIMTIIYIISLYVLYAAIMNPDEAITLSAFDRYYSTMIIILVTIQLFGIINSLIKNNFSIRYKVTTAFILLFIILFIQKANAIQLIIKPNNKNFRRYHIQNVCEKARRYMGRNQKILLYNGNSGSGGYYYFVLTYEMLTNNCNIISKNNFGNSSNEDIQKLNNFDYIIIAQDKAEFFKEINLLENTDIDNESGCIYKIKKYDGKITLSCLG